MPRSSTKRDSHGLRVRPWGVRGEATGDVSGERRPRLGEKAPTVGQFKKKRSSPHCRTAMAAVDTVVALQVHQDFGWCVIVAAIMGIQCLLQGFAIGGIRKKLFDEAFYAKYFPELKAKGVGVGGYPDMGSGRFSEKLSFDDWLTFNNYQRAHYNYVEGIASAIAFELLAGLFFPRVATLFGLIYIIGRVLYARGYRANGPKGRFTGSLMLDLALVALFGSAVYGGFLLAGGLPGLQRLFVL